MPSIADSTMQLDTPAIPVTTPSLGVVAEPIISLPIRGVLPPNEVLDTVTTKVLAKQGAMPMWKIVSEVVTPLTTTKTTTSTATTTPTNSAVGVPAEVIRVSAVQEPYKTADGTVESLVAVSFEPCPGDGYFSGAQVWFTGYNGSSTPQLMASGTESPVEFVCAATKETVVVTVVAYGPTGLTTSFINAPTTSVTLNGVVSAPPAPSISQPVIAISGGWQFSFNVLGGLLADVIDGYWIYKSTSSSAPAPPSNRAAYLKQPATNVGQLIYQDIDASTEYFWVSAVSVSGLESALVPANGTTWVESYYPSVITGTYVNPANLDDGNETTCAEAVISSDNGVVITSPTLLISGWPIAPDSSAVSVKLKILSETDIATSGLESSGSTSLSYSIDGGTTWTVITSSSSSRAKQYDTIALPIGQDLSQVQVKASAAVTTIYETYDYIIKHIGADSIASTGHYIYEVRIEVTLTGAE